MFLICGTIAAVVTAATFLIGRRGPLTTVAFSAIAFVVIGFLGWAFIPTLAWNFYTLWVLAFVFGAGLSMGLGMTSGDRDVGPETVIPGGIVIVSFLMMTVVAWVTTEGFFGREAQYRAWLDREPVTRVFTEEVEAIDLDHLRLVNSTLAGKIAARALEQIPSLGSRVHAGTPDRQILNGCFIAATGVDDEAKQEELCFENELVYISPLAHDSVFRYWSYNSTPGYIIVSAEDPDRFWLVTGLVQNGEIVPINLRYLVDGGWFNHQVERYLRSNGYASTGIAEQMFEIDDTGRPYWVVTTYRKTIGFGGSVPTGVLIVDAQTGAIERHTMEDAPQWADMIQPDHIVHDMLYAWGQYVEGWRNGSFFGAKHNVVLPGSTEDMVTLHGTDGRSHYVTAMSSANSSQGAMNSFLMIDTRTREVARYMVSGATPDVACQAMQNAEGVSANGYTCAGTYPVNVAGVPSYFVPLQGSDGMLKMYGFINIRNLALLGTGNTPTEAYRAYQAALTRGGARLNADAVVHGERIEGTVEDVTREGEMIYLLITEQPGREFFASTTLSPELKWTEAGDRVVLTAQSGEQTSVPVVAFDNLRRNLNRPN